MGIIEAKNLVHEYIIRDEEGNVESIQMALDHMDLKVEPGQFIAVLGHNGSGKSTFAKHINALLTPTEGMRLTDGEIVADGEVYLGVNATPDTWREVTEAEADAIRAEAERVAEADAEGGA